MKQYYVNKRGQQYGPLTFEQISSSSLEPDNYVWYQGLSEWIKAKDLDEFKDRFTQVTSTPPPLPQLQQQMPTYQAQQKQQSTSTSAALITMIITIAVLIAAYLFYREYNDRQLKEQNPFYRMR